jgi:glycosyltransferase involved in cell wall biosynthesis
MMPTNKKVLWISDFNISQSPGGAQQSNDIIIKKGRELGYSIFEANYHINFNSMNFDEFDILISSNLEAISSMNSDIVDKISKHNYHVRLEHDMNRYLNNNDRKKLFESCKKTIFLTEYHYKLFEHNYGNYFKNIEIIFDPIDTNTFVNFNKEREDKILYVGFMHELKGTLKFFDYVLKNPQLNFAVAGWGSPVFEYLAKNIFNIEYLGTLTQTQMPELYNKYKTLYYSPVIPEPFCRSVAEGIICGINLMSDNQAIIGCLSELNKIGINNFIDKCSKAESIFWERIY